jgi:hypothetical protein
LAKGMVRKVVVGVMEMVVEVVVTATRTGTSCSPPVNHGLPAGDPGCARVFFLSRRTYSLPNCGTHSTLPDRQK